MTKYTRDNLREAIETAESANNRRTFLSYYRKARKKASENYWNTFSELGVSSFDRFKGYIPDNFSSLNPQEKGVIAGCAINTIYGKIGKIPTNMDVYELKHAYEYLQKLGFGKSNSVIKALMERAKRDPVHVREVYKMMVE